jgi:DNA primase
VNSATGHSDIDRVRDATDLVRLIGEHVALKPKGREHIGICPFHDDHRPSMHVVTHKGDGFYKCFACGASGDCFRFVMDFHKMEFPEALRYLADRAGITLTPRRAAPAPSGDAPRRSDLQKAAAFAADFFTATLNDPIAGQAGRDVIAKRGINDEMVGQFMLGVSPDGYERFLNRLGGKESAIRTALAAGLLKRRESGGCYDAFRNRLMFPICDDVGRPIAFGARAINSDDNPKYLNSAENPLFNKSRTLYGLHLAKRSIIESKQAVVTEGYTDVIACHQAGITNVIGTLGTALTTQHARVLSRLCDTVVLVFDGDEAGQKAADRGVEVFFAEPVDIRICVLPDQLDPDELLRQDDGPQRFRSAVDQALDALEYKLQRFSAQLATAAGLSARQKHLERFLGELADLGFNSVQGVRKRLLITRLADLLKLSIADIEQAMPRRTRRAAPQPVAPIDEAMMDIDEPIDHEMLLPGEEDLIAVSPARRRAERELLAVLLFEPAAGREAVIPDQGRFLTVTELFAAQDFLDPIARRIAEIILPVLAGGEAITLPQLLTQLGDPSVRAAASQLFFEGRQRCGDEESAAAGELAAAAAALRNCMETERYQRQVADFGSTGADDESKMNAVIEQIRNRQQQGNLPSAISQGIRS